MACKGSLDGVISMNDDGAEAHTFVPQSTTLVFLFLLICLNDQEI
jgi:hypothetical protein